MKKILIVGATSAIATACARRWAQRGDSLFLASRNAQALQTLVDDLKVRGAAGVGQRPFDATPDEDPAALIAAAGAEMQGLDMVLIAHGVLTDQARAQSDMAYLREQMEVNALSVVTLMSAAAEVFSRQGHGTLATISSVAGDRGRQSNYVYGSAKAVVSAFASGLRQRLHPQGIAVLTVKPGFVDTPMTAHLPKGGPLWAQPDRVAADIVAAMDAGKDVLYTPWFWRIVMGIIGSIPERVFRKLRL